ncbi:MAG: PIG-L family deacetylase [Desulfovibrio sp.]|jgi:LmbE family N-acetylglucosaminyl deacetylase|nr:PIG-L family deacetylase [Desulfovibrio sp.]
MLKSLIDHFRKKHYCAIHGINFDEKRCLLLAPHPDDELIGCGGTLIMHPKNFDVLCLATSGMHRQGQTPKENSRVRFDDFTTIMSEIGVNRSFIFEYYENGRCREFYPTMLNEYMKCVNVCDYNYIFLPHIHDNHPDHQYIVVLLKEMIKHQGYVADLKLVFYEVWSPLHNVNAYVSIDRVISDKCRFLKKYRTVGEGYAEPIKGLNRYRGLVCTYNEHNFLECFEVVDFYDH